LQQELGEVVRKPLPEIPKKYWEAFTTFADEEFGGDWGSAFRELVKEGLVEPEWLIVVASLDERVSKLEELVVEKVEEEVVENDVSEVMCDGSGVKEIE